ncbi:MAG: 6-phosphofructokinase [bacterium]|nr:6-phosphofructokinase [bacterium]
MKTLMVVSGGDAPGINSAIAHYTAFAQSRGDTVVGAMGGLPGLVEGTVVPLSLQQILPWAGHAGSLLQTSRDPVLSQPDAEERVRQTLTQHHIDGVLIFGGNGTLRYIPPLLQRWGVASVGIPTTIDNDVPGTELTLGFDSACNFAYHSIDGALLTAHALPGRMFMVETLGGNTGMLAVAVAHGAGAHAVLVPEYEYDIDWLSVRLINASQQHGYALLVLSEGIPHARTLADTLPQTTGIRMRDIRLGHAQRGAVPSHRDRVLAADMARAAYQALQNGLQSGVVIVRDQQVQIHEGILPTDTVLPERALYDRINGFSGV